MDLVKIRFDDQRFSWTVISDDVPVECIRDWIVHLEEINQSPNTIEAYARHIARIGSYLKANKKTLFEISVADYDHFLQWLPSALSVSKHSPENLLFINENHAPLSATLKNQVHLAVKSFYRYLSGRNPVFDDHVKFTGYETTRSYKPFLEHINARRSSRKKDRYLAGNLDLVQKTILEKRLAPEAVLELIVACQLVRDAFLLVLLYNTGMRIGEALGLRHTDIDLKDSVVWVIPRTDNENGARAKSRRTRAIPVARHVVDMYEDYVTSDEYIQAFESGTEYVFCNVQRGRIGRALSRSNAENLKNSLKRRTGHSFTWHQFRHTHASEAIADGHGLLAVADRLGHASPQTTLDFYKHLFSAEIRKLQLSGPEKLQERLEEFRTSNTHLTDRGAKWI